MTIKEQVIQARENGLSYSKITEEFGIPKSTAQDWVKNCSPSKFPNGHVNKNIQRTKPEKFQRTEQEVLNFLENLAPINLPRPSKTTNSSYSDYAIVMSDMHFPMHCQKSLDIAFETIRQLQPKTIVLNGDTVDMLSISRYPKDIRHNFSLLDERKAYHQFLMELVEVSNGAEIIETHANHSGNGTEGRWYRYLSERIGELACLPEIMKELNYENVFLGQYKYLVSHVDYVELCPDLIVIHGDVVRKNGGYSARGMMDKYFQSLIMGHTHRIGMTAQRIPGIGSRPEKQIYAWEMGCMCDLNPVYASYPNWQNGFGIISLSDGGGFGVEPVLIQNGAANISTLGQTIRA